MFFASDVFLRRPTVELGSKNLSKFSTKGNASV